MTLFVLFIVVKCFYTFAFFKCVETVAFVTIRQSLQFICTKAQKSKKTNCTKYNNNEYV